MQENTKPLEIQEIEFQKQEVKQRLKNKRSNCEQS